MKNILVPISFSETSKTALKQAELISKQYSAQLSLLHCYPVHTYNRTFDFGKLSYDQGINQMLKDFYLETIGDVENKPINRLSFEGPVSDVIRKISHAYDLLTLARKTGFHSHSNKWFSDKLFYLTSKSLCPVLLLPSKRDSFSFSNIRKIWHIKRRDVEPALLRRKISSLKINPESLLEKSLEQKSFSSNFWRSIVNFSNTQNKDQLVKISESFADEDIDLLILVNHGQGLFEGYLKDDVFQIVSQFDIPILVLHAKHKAKNFIVD